MASLIDTSPCHGPLGHLHMTAVTRVVATAVIALTLLAGGCATSSVGTTGGTEDSTTVPTSGQTETSAGAISATQLVEQFSASWEAGDWTTLRPLSTDAVVETAREWYVAGLEVQVVEPIGASGGELLVLDPQGGRGLIFSFGLSDADGALAVTSLIFGGDAG